MADRRRGCSCSGNGCGCVVGLILGAAIASSAAWGWWAFYKHLVSHPLMSLEVVDGPLSVAQTKNYVDRLAAEFVSSPRRAGLVVGILKNGETHTWGYGWISGDRREPPDGDTVFELASCGKTFTATLLADLHRSGALSWDAPLEEFLPPDAIVPTFDDRQITLIDLATHTSALPSLTRTVRENAEAGKPNPWKDNSMEQVYRDLAEIKLSGPVGQKFAYSNFGMGLLGHALERHTDMNYEQLVIQHICEPLEMTSTKMTLDDAMRSRLAVPHHDGRPTEVWEDETLAGAGSFLSSASDMLKFLAAHFDSSNPLYDTLQTTIAKRRVAGSPWESVGLAWHITSENAVDIVWHAGGAGGSSSYVAMIPQSEVGVVMLANSSAEVSIPGEMILYLLHLH